MTDIKDQIAVLPGLRDQNTGDSRFQESWTARLRRWGLGFVYALMPKRIAILPRILVMSAAQLFVPEAAWGKLPEDPKYYGWQGLVGVSDDLSVDTLIANYKRGFFPFCHVGPVKWWCPEERAVIDPAETHVSKNLRRLMRQQKFRISFDRNFADVIEACAKPREGKTPLTWITPKIMQAYWEAHQAGYAHSVEVWDEDDNLVGGLYGLAIGKVFFGESQFSRADHASKVALIVLHRHLAEWGFKLRDAKWVTSHLKSFGFRAMPRDDFLEALDIETNRPGLLGPWQADPALAATRDGGVTPKQPSSPKTLA